MKYRLVVSELLFRLLLSVTFPFDHHFLTCPCDFFVILYFCYRSIDEPHHASMTRKRYVVAKNKKKKTRKMVYKIMGDVQQKTGTIYYLQLISLLSSYSKPINDSK